MHFKFTALKSVVLMTLFSSLHFIKCQEISVRRIIENRADLSLIAGDKYLKFTEVFSSMGNLQNTNLLFFAPQNTAILNMSNYLRNQLESASRSTINDIFSYHLARNENKSNFVPSTFPVGYKTKLPTDYLSTYIFVNKVFGGVVFINGAQLMIPNLLSTNGVVNIIDKMFVDLGPTTKAQSGVNAFNYMTGPSSPPLTELNSLFVNYRYLANVGSIQFNSPNTNAVTDFLSSQNSYCTLFAPDDTSLRAFKYRNPDLYSRISGQTPATVKTVLDSLVIPNYSYHIEVLHYLSTNNVTVNALNGWIKVYWLNGQYQVMNQCGQATVTMANIATTNCVVHIVDNFLGLVGKDLYDSIMGQSDLKDFQTTIYSLQSPALLDKLKVIGGPEYVVPDSAKYTVFAPTADIFHFIDFSSNPTVRDEQLSMSIVAGVIDLSSVTGSFKVNTLRNGYQATISKVGQDIYVEVDYVKARIVQSNICSRNGLLHKIDSILGVPEAVISRYLLKYPIYRRAYNLLYDTGMLTLFENPTNRLSFFAPNDSAIANLDQAFLGQQNKNKLKDLVSRHIARDVIFLDQSEIGNQGRVVDTFNGQFVLTYSDGAFFLSVGEQKVKVIQPNMRMQNGVIHVTDKFLPYAPASGSTYDVMNKISLLILILILHSFIFLQLSYHHVR